MEGDRAANLFGVTGQETTVMSHFLLSIRFTN
jgi:hypothetical protein